MHSTTPIAIIGGGPAGLMAADVLCQAGYAVDLFDTMPSVGRKFLLAGKGGLNLTHSEDFGQFVTRYGARSSEMHALLQDFDAEAVRAWAASLGVPTFVGTSGRVFPTDMKAAPLLRAWLHRLKHPSTGRGLQMHMRHRWTGWAEDGALTFEAPQGTVQVRASATVLALGGGSWSRLGSNGAWMPVLAHKGVATTPLLPANCGFDVQGGWSEFFSDKFAGQPFKSVAIRVGAATEHQWHKAGEFIATATGVEGGLIYAASQLLRDEIIRNGHSTLYLDLLPHMPLERVQAEVSHPRGTRSLSSHLKSRLHLEGIKSAILYEVLEKSVFQNPAELAAAIKALPIRLQATRPLDEAISSAGGVRFEALNPQLMSQQLPGVFCAGEMLDWEAPTGGYLLTACFASGKRAGQGVMDYLQSR
jgi:uncharacterized flavoprotein (TIGR03862 family)